MSLKAATRKTKLWPATSVVVGAALVLSGCSPASTDPTAESTLVDSGSEIEEITVALPGSLSNLYTGQEAGILNYYIASVTQEGLVSMNPDGTIVQGLAESWEQTDDVTYVFTLRDDALFQNGEPVTADDVVFSLEQAQDETASPNLAFYLGGVEGAEATADNEVTVTLTAPDASFLVNMSTAGALFVTQQVFWEEHDGNVGTSESLLLGTGPYQVTEFVPDSHVTFDRVDTWWGGTPAVKQVTVEFIPDENTRLLAAQSGDIDLAFNVPLTQVSQWQSIDTMRVESANDLSYVGLLFDTRVAPFDDPKVRQAIAHSIDKDAIVTSLLRDHGESATAMMTPESLAQAYQPEEAREQLATIPQYEFDLDQAAQVLSESSVPEGFTAEFTYPATGPQLGTAAQAIAENLSTIGIDLDVREVPIEEWLATIGDGEHGIGYMWYFSTTGDPAEVPNYLLGEANPSGYENDAILDLLAQAGSEQDPAERVRLLIEAETLQATDAVNVPLWWGQSITAFASDLGIDQYSSFAFLSSWPASLFQAE